jgi:hypothetical protein
MVVGSKEYTVALALTSKTDLWIIWMYRKLNIRPSDIAQLLNIPKAVVKNVVVDKIKKVDPSLIDDPRKFKCLVNLPVLYIKGSERYYCTVCGRTYGKTHLTQHLMVKHPQHVKAYITYVEVGCGGG